MISPLEAAGNLDFEEAAPLRDYIKRLKTLDLEFARDQLGAH
jgi:excinuclease ABC subunit B